MEKLFTIVSPFILLIVASTVGYFFKEVTEELRANPTLVYSLAANSAGTRVHISNVSREVIIGATLHVTCAHPPCFQADQEGDYARTFTTGPIGTPDVIETHADERYVALDATLLPTAGIGVQVLPIQPASEIIVSYHPPPQDPQDIRVIQATAITGFVALHHLEVMGWAFVVAIALAMIYLLAAVVPLAAQLFTFIRGNGRKEASDEVVHLRVSFDVSPDDSKSGSSRNDRSGQSDLEVEPRAPGKQSNHGQS